MKFSEVEFKKFKPYYKKVGFDLSVSKDSNIVLIGGRNGQGKTSFLVGVVWCLYGKSIGNVDEVYKKEIKGNYTKFLTKSLNRVAQSEGIHEFSVKVVLLPLSKIE